MARIKIKDLPKDMKVSSEEMRMVRGGEQDIMAFQKLEDPEQQSVAGADSLPDKKMIYIKGRF